MLSVSLPLPPPLPHPTQLAQPIPDRTMFSKKSSGWNMCLMMTVTFSAGSLSSLPPHCSRFSSFCSCFCEG